MRLYILQNSAQHSAGRSSLKWFLGEAVPADGQELWQGQPVLSRTYKVHGVRVQALQVDAPGVCQSSSINIRCFGSICIEIRQSDAAGSYQNYPTVFCVIAEAFGGLPCLSAVFVFRLQPFFSGKHCSQLSPILNTEV